MPEDEISSPSSPDEIVYEPGDAEDERRSSVGSGDAKLEEQSDFLRESHASSNATLADENALRDTVSKLPTIISAENPMALKVQPPRVTLQEKSVNILPVPRTRVTRSTRRR